MLNHKQIKELTEFKKYQCSELIYMDMVDLLPHESIIEDRVNGLKSYIDSLSPDFIIPSIILSQDNVIIDGHHRYNALKELNVKYVPTIKINYESKIIMTHFNDNECINKSEVIKAGITKQMLKPKTTMHRINLCNERFPIIILSEMSQVKI
tara:strand:+ start:1660 stop:2115 length:456 start_codon:yes stop_codon:yes gene_type:complete